MQIIFVTYLSMRSLSLGNRWTRLTALVLLPILTVNILSVSLVTAASGDEYLTGSHDPIVEMIAPDVWLDAALAEQTGSIKQVLTESGTTELILTGSELTLTGETTLTPDQTGPMVSESSGTIDIIGTGETVSSGIVMTETHLIDKQEDMVLKADGDIEVNTGIVLEDISQRVTMEISNGTIINTVDAYGQEVEGSTGQVILDSNLDEAQRTEIEIDTTIQKLGK